EGPGGPAAESATRPRRAGVRVDGALPGGVLGRLRPMEHEVYVPFAVEAVRAALAEPERVARCVPGLQPEETETVSGDGVALRGRLRVRIGGSSITYRGSLRLT